jgi:DNA-binding FadR family transcriptional regulator
VHLWFNDIPNGPAVQTISSQSNPMTYQFQPKGIPVFPETRGADFATGRNEEISDVLAFGSGRASNVIFGRLKQAIETGIYAHGDQLPAERQLAITFQSARSTIRKVLDQLEEMKLVTRRAGSGTFVNYPGLAHRNLNDLAAMVSPLQLIETRFAIEPYMTRLASIHANIGDLENIGKVVKQLEDCGGDQDLFTQHDCEFHLELARCSRNPLIVRMYQQVNLVRLHAQWDRMKKLILTREKITQYNSEHRAIFEALLHRDTHAAVELIKGHLEQARTDLIGADRL